MRGPNKALLGLLGLLVVAQSGLYQTYLQPYWSKNYSTKAGPVTQSLDPSQMFLSLFGAREFLAGILWVKADSFFDQGNYDAVLPIIRLCTILDPKQIDVYATGMWHIGYNFTDEEQRSDRRYLPSAIALGKEGAAQNPHTYEMYFETGWMWYHKIDDDYHQSVYWFQKSQEQEDILPARKDVLRNAYERQGRPDLGLELLYRLYDEANARPDEYGNNQIRDTIRNNIDTTLVRLAQRGWFAQNTDEGKGSAWFQSGNYDTKPPFDTKFSVKATVLEPRVIRFEGTWGVRPVGTRIRVILRDEEYNDPKYPKAKAAELEWDTASAVTLDPPRNLTYMQDQLFVRNQRFNRKVDMSKDPTMYPFTSDKYLLEFYYNPRSAPPHIQDKFGFSGEGFTDSNFLNLEVRKDQDGKPQRVMYTTLSLTRDQILRRGEWRDKVPVVKTKNYVEGAAQGGDDVVTIPSLRSSGK